MASVVEPRGLLVERKPPHRFAGMAILPEVPNAEDVRKEYFHPLNNLLPRNFQLHAADLVIYAAIDPPSAEPLTPRIADELRQPIFKVAVLNKEFAELPRLLQHRHRVRSRVKVLDSIDKVLQEVETQSLTRFGMSLPPKPR